MQFHNPTIGLVECLNVRLEENNLHVLYELSITAPRNWTCLKHSPNVFSDFLTWYDLGNDLIQLLHRPKFSFFLVSLFQSLFSVRSGDSVTLSNGCSGVSTSLSGTVPRQCILLALRFSQVIALTSLRLFFMTLPTQFHHYDNDHLTTLLTTVPTTFWVATVRPLCQYNSSHCSCHCSGTTLT